MSFDTPLQSARIDFICFMPVGHPVKIKKRSGVQDSNLTSLRRAKGSQTTIATVNAVPTAPPMET
jgi:hypothetical protein